MQHLRTLLFVRIADFVGKKETPKQNPKKRGVKPNVNQQIDLQNFFTSLEKQKSHYNPTNPDVFIQKFTTLKQAYSEYIKLDRTCNLPSYELFRQFFKKMSSHKESN